MPVPQNHAKGILWFSVSEDKLNQNDRELDNQMGERLGVWRWLLCFVVVALFGFGFYWLMTLINDSLEKLP